tara:strand:+ start:422 stop:1720 length:1299 start_codon:yes stop_codon:yes gene_type:complete
VNKVIFIILLLITANCSLDTRSGLWTKNKDLKSEENKKIKKLFLKKNTNTSEFNRDIKVKFQKNSKNIRSFSNDNNNGLIDYQGNLENVSKYKFSKINRFNEFDPEFIFKDDNIIFFDNKGSIIKFDNNSKLIWKKNYYSKSEKKLNPILFMASYKDTIIVADSLSKYYAINVDDGKIIWSKRHVSPFNSQIKIYQDKVFLVDSENTLNCYSIIDGTKIWELETEQSFINSSKKLSIVLKNNKIYFNNSLGDITAVDIESGSLLWQISTQNSNNYEDIFNLETSDLIADDKTILFSNNKNKFYSLDQTNGSINWKQDINSKLRPTLIGNLVVTVSLEGYLYLINNKTGDIIRITDIFDRFKKQKRKSIKPIGFLVGSKSIYVSTSNGKLIIVDSETGKSKSIYKIGSSKLSRPLSLNQNIFIIKNNSIIKLD